MHVEQIDTRGNVSKPSKPCRTREKVIHREEGRQGWMSNGIIFFIWTFRLSSLLHNLMILWRGILCLARNLTQTNASVKFPYVFISNQKEGLTHMHWSSKEGLRFLFVYWLSFTPPPLYPLSPSSSLSFLTPHPPFLSPLVAPLLPVSSLPPTFLML